MPEISRRRLLAWTGGAGATGLVAGMAGGVAAERGDPSGVPATDRARMDAYERIVSEHQVPHGLDRPVPAFGHVLAMNLRTPHRADPTRARDIAVHALSALAAMVRGSVQAQEHAAAAAPALGSRPSGLQLTPGI